MRTSRWMLMLAARGHAARGLRRRQQQPCEPCTNVDDCESGLTCQQFRDANGNIRNLCGDANPNMTCPAN